MTSKEEHKGTYDLTRLGDSKQGQIEKSVITRSLHQIARPDGDVKAVVQGMGEVLVARKFREVESSIEAECKKLAASGDYDADGGSAHEGDTAFEDVRNTLGDFGWGEYTKFYIGWAIEATPRQEDIEIWGDMCLSAEPETAAEFMKWASEAVIDQMIKDAYHEAYEAAHKGEDQ